MKPEQTAIKLMKYTKKEKEEFIEECSDFLEGVDKDVNRKRNGSI